MSTEKKVVCAYWDGKCQAMCCDDIPDLKKTLIEWLADGADTIKILPLEEGKSEFSKGTQP